MTELERAFDLVLAIALAGVAWRALASRDLFKAVVLFIVFGLLMALTWVRLDAPDIALAEAAIGAGLTGALLIEAVSQMSGRPQRTMERRDGTLDRQAADPAESGVAGTRPQ